MTVVCHPFLDLESNILANNPTLFFFEFAGLLSEISLMFNSL